MYILCIVLLMIDALSLIGFSTDTQICIMVHDDDTNDYVRSYSEERGIIIIQENLARAPKRADLLDYMSFTNGFEF